MLRVRRQPEGFDERTDMSRKADRPECEWL